MRTIGSRIAFALMGVLIASTLLAASPAALAPGEARYAVTLNSAVQQPDFAGLGGRVESQDGSSLTVVLPAKASMTLTHDPAVVLMRELDPGTPEPAPAPVLAPAVPQRNVTEDAFRKTPLDAVTLWSSGQYVYDGAGNITAIGTSGALNSDGKVSTFTYDAASRLKTAAIGRATGGDIVESYSYDGFGNILQHVRSSPAASAVTFSPLPSLANNRMTELGTVYDSAGNVTTLAGGTTLTYDAFNQVISKTSPTATAPEYAYIYDVNEERIGIEYGAATHWTIRDFDNKPLIQFDGPLPGATQTQWTWVESFVWAGGKMVMAERPAGTGGGPLHYHVDHLGSTRVVTDANGQPLAPGRIDYAPFGEEITPSGGELLKFTGHERDYDLSNTANDNYLDYMHARYYDSRRGRFLSVDPVLGEPSEPQSWNRYKYATNNPLRFIDADGRDPRDSLKGFGNAFISDVLPWLERDHTGLGDYKEGQRAGDVAALAVGLSEVTGGLSGSAGSLIVSATGVGALVGVPALAASVVVAGHGVITVTGALLNLASSVNQMNHEVKTGKAPSQVKEVHKGNTNVKGEQDHVHFNAKKNTALNKDGTWKHRTMDLAKDTVEWLVKNGWKASK